MEIEHGADLINISLYYRNYDPDLKKAISDAVSKGIIEITSEGNFGNDNIGYPALFNETLSIFSTTHQGEVAEYSGFSERVDAGAVGGEVRAATDNAGKWMLVQESGTSYLAAIVTGYLALLMEANLESDSKKF